jgi:CubicO group peptidase (beta-lactamase class C family)
MATRWFLCLFTLLVFHTENVSAQTNLSARQKKVVVQAVGQQMDRQKAVGLAVGIIRDGKVVYVKGYGFADRENQIPASTKTMFRWASISKTLTAIAAMQLVEKGELDLNADVRTLVPEFPDTGTPITVWDLLCHQSGIVHYSNGPVVRTQRSYDSPHPFESVIIALDTFKDSPLLFKPREKYSYSTHAYILLSAVVERAGQKRFTDQVSERIIQPLKLDSLQPDYQWIKIDNRAVGYKLTDGSPMPSTDTDVSWKLGGGGYISTVGDLADYAAAIVNGKLLKKETWSLVSTVQSTSDGKPTPLGLGFFVDGAGPKLRLAHDGSQEKAKTRMVLYPIQRSAVVVMSNSENVNPGEFTTAIFGALSQTE